jgi:hypothetical protein
LIFPASGKKKSSPWQGEGDKGDRVTKIEILRCDN